MCPFTELPFLTLLQQNLLENKSSRNEAQTAGIYLREVLFQRPHLAQSWDVEHKYTWVEFLDLPFILS